MAFLDWIIEELTRAEGWFYDAYLTVRDWWPPFDLLKYPLYGLYGCFKWLVEAFWDFYEWLYWVGQQVEDILSWSNIRSLILSWLPDLEDAITFISSFMTEIELFFSNPINYLRTKFEYNILPWAIVNIPFFGTLYSWYTNFKSELEAFFSNPISYLRTKFEYNILPWAIGNIPFISMLYTFYLNYKGEFAVFIDDPIAWIRSKFENDILPWAKENIPFFSTLAVWVDWYGDQLTEFIQDPVGWLRDNTILGEVETFLSDPLKWLYDRVEDFMDRYW